MRTYLTAAVIAALISATAVSAAPTRTSRSAVAAPIAELMQHGTPTSLGGYTIPLGTVPDGETWTLKHILLIAEKHAGDVPRGGEFTVSLMIDGVPIAESSVATGNRVNYQGETSIDVDLPAGTTLGAYVWLGNNPSLWDTDLSHYFFGASVLVTKH